MKKWTVDITNKAYKQLNELPIHIRDLQLSSQRKLGSRFLKIKVRLWSTVKMRTEKFINIHHPLAKIKVEPQGEISGRVLKHLICVALDNYAKDHWVSAEVIHQEAKKRHGEYYRTPGYYLKIFRLREDLTQMQLASLLEIKQHHLSEMEHNKRSIGKKLAKQIAEILNIDYQKLL